MTRIRIFAGLLMMLGLLACRREEPPIAAGPGSQNASAGVVDSIFSVEQDIARFKATRANSNAVTLRGGSQSRAALITRFYQSIETNDTAALRAMVLDDAEFIDLYYPASMYVRPPYRQSPELVWFLIQQSSSKGIRRALDRFGGRPGILSKSPIRLFGPIIERDGEFKFLSYANDL